MFTLEMFNSLDQSERVATLRNLGISYVDVHGEPRQAIVVAANDSKSIKAALDSIPNLATTPNAGTAGYKLLAESPEVVPVLFAPVRSREIAGEQKLGTFADNNMVVNMKENTGTTVLYGDYEPGGTTSVNTNRETRDFIRFQSWVEIAVLEEEQYAKQGGSLFNLRAEKDISVAYVIDRQFNAINFKGVSGLNIRGLSNDSDLLPAIAATAQWSTLAPEQINSEVVKIVNQLISQSNGLLTGNEKAVLALPPAVLNSLKVTNSYGWSAFEMINKNFPNLRMVAVPEYGVLGSGNTTLIQYIVEEIEGVKTVEYLYTEKFRVFPTEQYSSYSRKKVAASSGGALIKRPFAIVNYYGA